LRADDNGLREKCGTLSYMAPEMINKTGKIRYHHSVDIWSAGVVLYTMIYG
jgi:serine/threonine protein kinase